MIAKGVPHLRILVSYLYSCSKSITFSYRVNERKWFAKKNKAHNWSLESRELNYIGIDEASEWLFA